jgi:hypothetical protein
MGASTYDRCRLRIRQEVCDDRVSFVAVEQEIRGTPLPTDAKAALWLYAWSLRDHGPEVREAEEIERELTPLD